MALHRAARLGGGVAGADGGSDVRRHSPGGLDLVADAHQRRAQVAVDVVGQRLQRRDIKDAAAFRVSRHRFGGKSVEAPQESGQGLAAPGGSRHENVAARGDLTPAALLDLCGLGEGGAKPVPRGRTEQIENIPHAIKFDRFPVYKQVFVYRLRASIGDDRRT